MTGLIQLKTDDQVYCKACASRRLAWFKPCTKEMLDAHETFRSSQYELKTGEYLFLEGDTPTSVYTLQDGWIICFKTLANGQRQVLHIGLAGDFIGYRSDFDKPVDYSVMALAPCIICSFSRRNLLSLMAQDGKLTERLLEIQSTNSEECRTRLTYIGQAPAKFKVAYFLNNIVSRLQERGVDTSKSIYFPLTREEIADAIGITSVHLCRISVELRRLNIVDCRHNRLDIMNNEKLQEMANSVFGK